MSSADEDVSSDTAPTGSSRSIRHVKAETARAVRQRIWSVLGCAIATFRDWAAEMIDHPREVIEAALAYVVPNKVEAAYVRSDLFERRRRLMDDWESVVCSAQVVLYK